MYYEIIAAYENIKYRAEYDEDDGGNEDNNDTETIPDMVRRILEKYGHTGSPEVIIKDLSSIYDTLEYLPLNVGDLPCAMRCWAEPSDTAVSYTVLGFPQDDTLKAPDIVDADSAEQALSLCILKHKPELLDMDQEAYDCFLHETPDATFYNLVNFYLMWSYYDDNDLVRFLNNNSYAHVCSRS